MALMSWTELVKLVSQKRKKKILMDGDYFGEVSFLYNCRRTATIKAKQYGTLGQINHDVMNELLREFPDFKKHLQRDVVKLFNDDLKLFLLNALKRVDYLASVSDEILTELAYSMIGEIKEKGSVLYSMEEEYSKQVTDEMVVIFEGSVELYLTMDAGTELTIEYLQTGSILNAHNFLARRKHSVNIRFAANTTFYYLKYGRIVEVARKYSQLA